METTKKFELNKCEHTFKCSPEYFENGMVYASEDTMPEVLAVFDSKEEALEELAKYACSVDYGFQHGEVRATEYWVEVVVYDEDGDPIDFPECYPGKYPDCKIYNQDIMLSRYPDSGFLGLADNAEQAKEFCQDERWLADHIDAAGTYNLCVIDMDGEKIASFKVELKEEEN